MYSTTKNTLNSAFGHHLKINKHTFSPDELWSTENVMKSTYFTSKYFLKALFLFLNVIYSLATHGLISLWQNINLNSKKTRGKYAVHINKKNGKKSTSMCTPIVRINNKIVLSMTSLSVIEWTVT